MDSGFAVLTEPQQTDTATLLGVVMLVCLVLSWLSNMGYMVSLINEWQGYHPLGALYVGRHLAFPVITTAFSANAVSSVRVAACSGFGWSIFNLRLTDNELNEIRNTNPLLSALAQSIPQIVLRVCWEWCCV